MPGRELPPLEHGDQAPAGRCPAGPVLPATVAAGHLAACAADLARDTTAARIGTGVGTAGELAEVVESLVAGQRQTAAALTHLGAYLGGRRAQDALAAAPAGDLAALVEVVRAAASATGCSADALAAGVPLVAALVTTAGNDTRL